MCVTTVIFLLYSVKFGECFKYLQRVLKTHLCVHGAIRNENALPKWTKIEIFEMVEILQNLFWTLFWKNILVSNGSINA